MAEAANPLGVAEIVAWLRRSIAELLEVDESMVDPDAPFESYGLASSDAVFLTGDLSELMGREVSATLAWDHPSIQELATFLAAVARGEVELPDDALDWDLGADLIDPG